MTSSSSSDATDVMINGEASSSSRIIPAAMTGRSQLAAAFTALDESDQYDAVLTGLCAKILDNDQAATAASLEDSAALLTEMNQRNIPASPRSLMSLIDATVKTQDTTTMTDILRLARQNKAGLNQYGILQSDIVDMPAGNQQVACADGSRKTRAERLESLPDVPVDDRGTEIASAMATLGVVGICFLANLFGMDDITPVTNLLWFTITTVGVVDNFYDVLQFGSNAAISSLNTTDTNKENLKLPQKESLPFGLGTGELTGTVTRGLTRLFSTDTERECQVEAAALYTAYVLGLPCFAFRPNSLEAANLMVQHEEQNLLSTTSGILKVLIWLMAPVAMESMKHPQLICSDPREASGLLQRLQDYAGKNNLDNLDSLWWMLEESPEQETQDLLKWAYHEADVLIRNNLKDVTEMSQRLTGGAATIGDCVAVVERW
ncbi:expressed unknown protein [Seminavis robusta]|uniref:Uncharacterized protein n=1 Tax=Seminavis robusta TaxID=568900 RepID=A0A9N8HTA1_9STRA|nr:expressed unknown protein [Seminavis robusta]|eukprot:Sro1550_g281750.1 n/a (434) ;mRNA; r:24836-26454